ncbi:alpha/beta fold hydrolase [Thermopolyspora sp. NPDC052614]|uniref:alpha/beta fold hydrolase n=1 Tax=Thermopolyspora sp. NPDC052614 TaxID=3155682 RepID=UPI0034134DE3
MSAIYASPEGEQAIKRHYRDLLDRWPVPSEHLRVPTSQGETFVVTCGPADAPPVVLLHGSGTNSAMWLGDIPDWAPHLRLYAVDIVGEPGLSAPSRPALNSQESSRWLGDVLEGLSLDHTAFVGASLGGWTALDFATRHPERVERLALLCPGGIGRQKIGVLLASVLLLPLGNRGRNAAMRMALGPNIPATPKAKDFTDYIQLIHRNFRPRHEQLPVFGDDALARLTMPVMATLGAHDRMLDSHATRRRLEQAVPHARIDFLPDAGHLIAGRSLPILDFLQQPEETHSQS